jgi:Cys-rich four helix bundle protein (predicted Tat secretion target)
LLLGVAAVATAAVTGAASADTASSHVEHGTHGQKYQGLTAAAHDCIGKGQTCIHHCLEEFKAGTTELAECAARVQEMDAMCSAFSYFAAADAPRLKEMSKVCVDVCKDCEQACRKHEDKHAACKSCAEACAKLVKSIETTLA